MVVDAESARFLTESTIARLQRSSTDMKTFHEEFASLTTGSGAVAMLLANSDLEPDGHRFTGTVSLAATEHNRLCLGQLDHGWTDTKRLMLAGIELSERTWQKAQDELGLSDADVDQYCLHQVSTVHAHQLAAAFGVNIEKTLLIVREYGNVGPASVPMVLSMALDQGRIQKGDRIVLAGIGSGINCMVGEVIW
jgi:3-oxoacyl-[acyl-carrier-protein] synthase III